MTDTSSGGMRVFVGDSCFRVVFFVFAVEQAGLAGGLRGSFVKWCGLDYSRDMYEDFEIADHWTGESLRCTWKGTIVAIATRHADATDIRFSVNHKPVWIAMPNLAWVEQKKRTGFVITDYLAAQTAGRYLKTIIESGYDNGREMYTMTVDEVLEHAAAVVEEAGHTDKLPTLPVINDNVAPETLMGRLPGDNVAQAVSVTVPDHPSSVIPTAN